MLKAGFPLNPENLEESEYTWKNQSTHENIMEF